MLKLKNVTKTYDDAHEPVFSQVSLHVGKCEFVSIIGPSGCGKSTLLEVCAGLQRFNTGTISLDGINIDRPGLSSFMPQGHSLLPWRRLNKNIALPFEVAGIAKDKALEQANQLLEQFNMSHLAKRWPNQLSGGQQKRGALLRSIAHDKNLIMLDEPLESLDSLTRQNIQIWLKDLFTTQEKSALMVTHDIDEAVFFSDRIYVMGFNRPLKEVYIHLKHRDRDSIEFRRFCTQIKGELNLEKA
ncbi:MAG: ABC transporter ATP-binding protein [Alphaproteobacteria bacterium]